MIKQPDKIQNGIMNVANVSSSVVYVPSNAKINLDFNPMSTPEVEYEKRKWEVNRDEFKHKVEKRSMDRL